MAAQVTASPYPLRRASRTVATRVDADEPVADYVVAVVTGRPSTRPTHTRKSSSRQSAVGIVPLAPSHRTPRRRGLRVRRRSAPRAPPRSRAFGWSPGAGVVRLSDHARGRRVARHGHLGDSPGPCTTRRPTSVSTCRDASPTSCTRPRRSRPHAQAHRGLSARLHVSVWMSLEAYPSPRPAGVSSGPRGAHPDEGGFWPWGLASEGVSVAGAVGAASLEVLR